MIFSWKKVLVVGAARSGLAVAEFAAGKGAEVWVSDLRSDDEIKKCEEKFAGRDVHFIWGKNPAYEDVRPDLIVPSPAVPLDLPVISKTVAAGGDVFSEIELAYRFSESDFIGITGTNGKTTTTALTGKIFADAGRKVMVGGNIGNPVADRVEDFGRDGKIVVELSSFQLESTVEFSPRIAMILNITPDHLNRHGTMEAYGEAKARIFVNQGKEDLLILNGEDTMLREMAAKAPGRTAFFSSRKRIDGGTYLEDGCIWTEFTGEKILIAREEDVFIRGKHNMENVMAAVICALDCGIPLESIRFSLKDFRGYPHRLEFSGEVNGVKYINDSKGTNPDASIKAIEAFDEPIVLIAGGRNKGNDFTAYIEALLAKSGKAVIIGECSDELTAVFEKLGSEDYFPASGWQEALEKATAMAAPGSVVLLSPACASWDMFESYEQRGDMFKEYVKSIGG